MTTNPAYLRSARATPVRLLQAALVAVAATLAIAPVAFAAESSASASNGTITGIVTNKTTGNGLEGARVEIPALGLSTLVDHTGRYVLAGVPPGPHEMKVSYTSLDEQRAEVTVSAGQRATRDFEMTSAVYMLDAFKVAGEKEGNAAALQQKRNADNLKEVVAMDAFGNLPNLNATELALRLPGISFGDPGDEVVEQIQVRGMGQGTTVITIDGALMSSFSAQNRTTRMTAFNGTMFDSLEVIKGQTPDKGADSLGGTVNFRTRSPLSMREKRRVSYTANMTNIPRFEEAIPLFRKRPTHELLTLSYQEKFKAFGSSDENLGVFINAFYSENAFGYYETTRDFQQTNTTPAYLWDYRTRDDYNNRMQRSVNTKFDYRLGSKSMLHLNLVANDAPEPGRRQYNVRANAGNSATAVPNATNSAVVVGAFTDRVTVVRANPTAANAVPGTQPAAVIDLSQTLFQRNQRLRHGDLSGEHTIGAFDVDWNTTWSRTRYRTLGNEAGLTNRIGGVPVIGPHGRDNRITPSATNPQDNLVGPNGESGVGWILDRTESDLYPRFIQNGGLDFTNPANYRPTQNGLNSNAGDLQEHHVRDAKLNIRYLVPIEAFQLYFKTGGELRDQSVLNNQFRRRWSYISKDPLPADPSVLLWPQVKTHWNIPTFEAAQFVEGGHVKDPSLWEEDRYFHEQTRYTGFTYVDEKVDAGYVMAQGKVGNTGFLFGLRREITISKAFAYNKIRAALASTAAQQAADPVGAAANDYARGFSERDGDYGKNFPSIHLYRNWTPNLKTRAAWSTSFARPGMNNMLPSASVNDTTHTVTVGNPGLLPQMAKNWDLTAEYYYEPSGSFTVGWFHKTITNYIASNVDTGIVLSDSNDNGFQGQYGGYEVFSSSNIGKAIAEGWEFSYAQQFRFLPGALKGLSLNANYTVINSHGFFGGTTYLKNDQVINFIPRTGNISLSWNWRKFGTRILYNYTSQNIRTAYNFAQPSRNQYMLPRELVNLGMTYRLSSNVTLQLDIANIFNEPQQYFRGIPDQMQMWRIQPTKWTVGVQGQF